MNLNLNFELEPVNKGPTGKNKKHSKYSKDPVEGAWFDLDEIRLYSNDLNNMPPPEVVSPQESNDSE